MEGILFIVKVYYILFISFLINTKVLAMRTDVNKI